MGNKIDSNYDLIDINIGFDPIESTINIPNKIPTKTVAVIPENIIADSKTINTHLIKTSSYNEIEQLFTKYSHKAIMHFYLEYSIEYLKKNDIKAIFIAKLLPINKKYNLINRYVNAKIDTKLITIMANNLNLNHVDKNNKTFLFKISVNIDEIDYLCKLFSCCDINVNHVYLCKTFLMEIIHKYTITRENLPKYIKLITILANKNYDFNITNQCDYSILTQFLMYKPDLRFYCSKLIGIKNYDVSKECFWLYTMVNKHWDEIHNYLYEIFSREDYIHILYDIYKNYHYPTYEDDFIRILIKMCKMDNRRTIEMLNYINSENGNTLLHEIAIRRGKKLLNFITYYFSGKVIIKQNNENKYPYDLYLVNNLENRLK